MSREVDELSPWLKVPGGATMPGGGAGAGGGGRPGIVPIPTDREEIFPEPGFVIKTIDDAGRKIFINVCGWGRKHNPRSAPLGSPAPPLKPSSLAFNQWQQMTWRAFSLGPMCGHAKIQAPGAKWADGKMPQEVETALTNLEDGGEDTQQLRFPLSVSEGRNELDKTGSACTVYDAVFNDDVVKQAIAYRKLKVFLVDLCLQWAGPGAGARGPGARGRPHTACHLRLHIAHPRLLSEVA